MLFRSHQTRDRQTERRTVIGVFKHRPLYPVSNSLETSEERQTERRTVIGVFKHRPLVIIIVSDSAAGPVVVRFQDDFLRRQLLLRRRDNSPLDDRPISQRLLRFLHVRRRSIRVRLRDVTIVTQHLATENTTLLIHTAVVKSVWTDASICNVSQPQVKSITNVTQNSIKSSNRAYQTQEVETIRTVKAKVLRSRPQPSRPSHSQGL